MLWILPFGWPPLPPNIPAFAIRHALAVTASLGWGIVQDLRATLDALKQTAKTLLMVVDGSYGTRFFFRAVLPRIEVLTLRHKN